ncbi:nitroreductase family protein [Thermoanaerobacterium sp. RBIITD]|uniref:nitroreductase family protein n=1 Tax=Thermoanaerobacterium sp. RBIITD TaxID=1550240 RepID=UPI000BB79F37|nr:nitroreductase family protein [Thermoanaerobacterium sp. RBIITD]SNX54849.1 Nitroreductase [Thermoanaerobacterium sp. RBIITD]
MEALDVLKQRRSVRVFEDKPIPKNILEDIIDCGRLAPTANNMQPWHFVVVTDKERLKYISEKATYGKFIKDAATCVIVYCESDNVHHLEDGAAATENIILAAKAYGISSCWVAGYDRTYEKDINEFLQVPSNLRMISIVPLGYSTQKPAARSKKPLTDVIHWEKF